MIIAPDCIDRTHKLYDILKMLEDTSDVAIKYDRRSRTDYTVPGAINGNLMNVLKDNVDNVFTQRFGYSSLIDPLFHQGVCVKKSIEQCTKDGKIYKCPIIPEDGYIYQKLIDSRISENKAQVIRVPVFIWCDVTIPFVWTVTFDVKYTFGFTRKSKYEVLKVSDVFSQDEEDRIFMFCYDIGINWAELDVLRDSDGLIYIIDVNNIPGNYAFKRIPKKYVQEYCQTFKEIFL